jgi:hypothetical protein
LSWRTTARNSSSRPGSAIARAPWTALRIIRDWSVGRPSKWSSARAVSRSLQRIRSMEVSLGVATPPRRHGPRQLPRWR